MYIYTCISQHSDFCRKYSHHSFCIKRLNAIITFIIFASAASQTILKPKQLMAKPIYSSLWTPRRSAAHSRTEVTCFSLNRGVSFLWNSSIPTYTTSEEWEREETLCRLIQPWNIASLLNAFQLQQRMWCVLSGPVSWRYSFAYFNLKKILNTKQLFSGSDCIIICLWVSRHSLKMRTKNTIQGLDLFSFFRFKQQCEQRWTRNST